MGLTSAEFWQLTPRQLQLLFDKFEAKRYGEQQLLAVFMTMYANSHRDKDAKPDPFEVGDFITNPSRPRMIERTIARGAEPLYRTQSVEEQKMRINLFINAFNSAQKQKAAGNG